MARPKPEILLEFVDKDFRSEQVLQADAIYAVFLGDQPINLKSVNNLLDGAGAKYKKTAFSNPGHAFNLCDRLNKLFKTDQFSVVRLTDGERIKEEGSGGDNGMVANRNQRIKRS